MLVLFLLVAISHLASSISYVDDARASELRLFKSYASAAYCASVAKNLDWSCERCLETPETIFLSSLKTKRTAVLSYVVYNTRRNEIIVSFRGTNTASIKNLLVDFAAWQGKLDCDNREVRIHYGMRTAYRWIADKVHYALYTSLEMYPNATVVFTGHSLGGALSVLAALDMYSKIPSISGKITVFTYGSPKIGNPTFAHLVNDIFGERIFRVVSKLDLFTYFPARDFLGINKWSHASRGRVSC